MRRFLIVAVGGAALLLPILPMHAESQDDVGKAEGPPAMVVGSISGVPGMKHVYIQKLGKVYVGRINRPKTQLLDGGAFFFDDVPAGEYYLAGFSRNNELFWFRYTKETVQDALFTVEPGELHYMGSYRVTEISRKKLFSRSGSFDIEAVASPGEARILEAIAPEVKGSRWAALIGERLKKASLATAGQN